MLVVEDDPAIARALVINLGARGYTVRHAATGAAALELAAAGGIDCVLLDLGLPDMPGLTVLDGIRGWSAVPLIVITARHELESKIEALDRGADDYVTKPFALGEVLARLRAALRRGPGGDEPEPSVIATADGALEVDLRASQVRRDGQPVRLTPHEWRIVEHLARNRDRLVARADLLRAVWGPGYEGETAYLRVYLSQIRAKLEPEPARPRYFLTELGMGYRFAAQGAPR
ncbi:response regulator [Brevibacterium sp. 5221]|uniref:Response regulator n=1 Tax=Brevibacterium rongguiense TaxID=2695267 RepID=A0A6N9H922_9MICO|nr:response regulator [Brevibacterium rongguiense]